MQSQIQTMLYKGVLRSSAWSAPTILVSKKSANENSKYRFCIDFRALNSVTKFDSYPLPIFEETVYTLHGSKYFTAPDFYSGIWHNHIKREPILPSRLVTMNLRDYHLDWLIVPPIFKGSWIVLRDLIGPICWEFIDDIIVFQLNRRTCAEVGKYITKFRGRHPPITPRELCKCSTKDAISRLCVIRGRDHCIL